MQMVLSAKVESVDGRTMEFYNRNSKEVVLKDDFSPLPEPSKQKSSNNMEASRKKLNYKLQTKMTRTKKSTAKMSMNMSKNMRIMTMNNLLLAND
jgi:hypothetical protein